MQTVNITSSQISIQEEPLFLILSQPITLSHALIAAAASIFLILLKIYISGGVCKVNKDLSGKIAVITGGNTGIGKQTTLQLAKRNCDIIIGARDKGRLQEVIKEITVINPKVKASYFILDLGEKASIKQFSQFVHSNCSKIDFLINNAGVMMVPQRRQTKDGLQMQIGINHFGHFYLTSLLFPLLKKSQEFRIINLSSKAHTHTKGINFDDLQSKNNYNDIVVYAKSKLSNIYFTRCLDKKIKQAKLNGMSVCLHPGVVRSELLRYLKWYMQIVLLIVYPLWYYFTKSSKEGAQTTLYTVLQDKQKLVSGQYYADCKVGSSTKVSKDMELAERLWKSSEQTLGIKFQI